MGNDPRESIVNRQNQMHVAENVFITDGSIMTSASCVNPSITYMALTARAVDYAIDQLQANKI
jgi:choline dehydrogenase-like flavoprotein